MTKNRFLLRDIQQDDLELILRWRNSDRIRINMYNDRIISWEEHFAWFNSLKNRADSIYKVYEHNGNPTGLVYFTDIDKKNGLCFWGFYIGRETVERGSGAIMGFLGLEYAFEVMNIRKICGESFVFNQSSIRFHYKLGFSQEGLFLRHIFRNEVYVDIMRFALFQDKWLENKTLLADKVFPKEF